MTNLDRDASEVTETLDRAWLLMQEAHDLARYACSLIENTTLKEQMGRVIKEVHAVKMGYIYLVNAWDMIPECKAIHERRSPTTVAQENDASR